MEKAKGNTGKSIQTRNLGDKLAKHTVVKKNPFTMEDNQELTPKLLKEFLDKHRAMIPRYNQLHDMYEGDYDILKQDEKETYKPDNRLVVNFAKYIVDTFGGFFIGVPIKTTHEDKVINDYLEYLDKYNDQDDNNAELSKLCDIYGHGYELLFTDEIGEVGITYIDPRECFIIYDKSIRQKPLYGVRYYINSDGEIEGTYSDSERIYTFLEYDDTFIVDEGEEHYFGDVPLIEYLENTERQGIFENVETLINAYNKAISEKANDVDYFADAYLLVLGALLDEDTMKALRDSRTISLAGDGDELKNVEIKFLEKPNADETQEHLIERLETLIFQISMVANINDEKFGTQSGIALQYKLQAMSNLAITKQRKFESGLNRRYRLIANLPNSKIGNDGWVKVEYEFKRNVPANLESEAEIISKLGGKVPNSKVLKVCSLVDNIPEALEELKEEDAIGPTYDFRLEEDVSENEKEG